MSHGFSYLSTSGFLGIPIDKTANKPYAIAGINWDGSCTNRPGARFGPSAIRHASQMLCDATHPLFDVSPLEFLNDVGDLPLPNTSIDAMRSVLMPLAAELIKNQTMVWLGGDHSITLPLLRAYHAHYKQPLACIHFDAHWILGLTTLVSLRATARGCMRRLLRAWLTQNVLCKLAYARLASAPCASL